MKIALLGVNHNTAPIEVRERLAIPSGRLADATRSLLHQPGVRESMILSTCNRVELVTCHEDNTDLRRFLAEYFAISKQEIEPHLYEYSEREAVRHLFRVASSLDSMVVGEPQILGQLRTALAVGQQVGTAGPLLHELMQQALRVGKRAHSETALDKAGQSMVTAALDLAVAEDAPPPRRTVVVGAGETVEINPKLVGVPGTGLPKTSRIQGSVVQAATGDLDALHDYTITATEAAVSTQLTTAVRNKALEAFQEIMRMSV